MRNVQVWSLVASLVIASVSYGQIFRPRRPCCQPTCQSCVAPASFSSQTVSNFATPISTSTTTIANYVTPVEYQETATPVAYESPVLADTQSGVETVVTPMDSSATATIPSEIVQAPIVESNMIPTETIVQSIPSATYSTPVSYTLAESPMTVSNASYNFRSTPRVSQASYSATYQNGNGDQMRVLSVVNEKRRRSGLPALMFDPSLTAVAQRKSYYRAMRGITGHDGTSMGGAAVEGVGYSYGQSDPVAGFNTCYLYSNGYQRAGVAISYDANNRAYYTLLLR